METAKANPTSNIVLDENILFNIFKERGVLISREHVR